MDSGKLGPKNCGENLEQAKNEFPVCKCGFDMLDAGFFNDCKKLEIQKGAKDFNIPIIRSNRKLVATENGGLSDSCPLVFNSAWKSQEAKRVTDKFNYPASSGIQRPKNDEDIAFMSVLELGQLLKAKLLTSEELTRIFLNRLKRYSPVLESVITITEELAFQQAKEADQVLAKGKYLGPLHGIPYGLKDIIAVPDYPTTWGSKSFKDQVIDVEAWVYKRLKCAGAVLVAKLVSGSLAYDDIWFGGRTRNPWNIEEFSTGSSAGPASSTSAGLVPFAIGSETVGSITYPATRCGVTAGVLKSKGVNMVPFNLDYTVDSAQGIVSFTMDVDMLAHFDEWQRSNQDDEFEAQDQWPLELRRARVISAVDYIQAQRGRSKLIREVKENFTVDAFIGGSGDWEKICVGNLVGMPVVVIPTGFKKISNAPSDDTRRKTTITTGIYAPPDHDHVALALAIAYQSVTNHHKQRPPIDDIGPNDSIPNPPTSAVPARQLRDY
ncbi:hypothetical protein AABB24_011318 [Solanum stoloniferum]|uniref:Amidase domain-containing protein n=1 Tax=Solanum stoloniferum TaxID=62892 RepID=A0ABD2UDP6_9SOLN